jgi:hypothetical protein
MKGMKPLLATMGLLVAAACSPGQVSIVAELDVPDPETEGGTIVRALDNMPVQLLPYDRDAIFDSIGAAAARPEPPIPDSLLAAQTAVAEAQEEWRSAEAEWNTLRDELQTISDELEGLNRGEARYRLLFNDFRDKDARLSTVERQMNAAFENFTALQEGTIAEIERVRMMREDWADEAFVDVNTVIAAKIEAAGLEPVEDTTDASGAVLIEAPPGNYWVHARHELPFNELYWNIPVTLVGGEPLEVRLTRETAEVRPKL